MAVQIIAHRGASRAERENTVAAFQRAAAMGAHAVELDVRRSADGALVVHHDALLGDGRAISATDAVDLPGHVPTLDQALDACAGMWVNIEIKNAAAEVDFDPDEYVAATCMAVLAGRGDDQRWLISSFRLETIDRCRQLNPAIRTAWLTSLVPDDVVALLIEHGHVALHPWVGMLTRDVVERCHAAGIAVNTWTCDDPERMAELIAWGIDGICTNVPDIGLTVLANTALPTPD